MKYYFFFFKNHVFTFSIYIFIIISCRRGLNPPHRVKSISMASFTPEEIEFVKSRGNEVCAGIFGLFLLICYIPYTFVCHYNQAVTLKFLKGEIIFNRSINKVKW